MCRRHLSTLILTSQMTFFFATFIFFKNCKVSFLLLPDYSKRSSYKTSVLTLKAPDFSKNWPAGLTPHCHFFSLSLHHWSHVSMQRRCSSQKYNCGIMWPNFCFYETPYICLLTQLCLFLFPLFPAPVCQAFVRSSAFSMKQCVRWSSHSHTNYSMQFIYYVIISSRIWDMVQNQQLCWHLEGKTCMQSTQFTFICS